METTLLSMVVGPAGAVVVMATILWWVGRLFEKSVLPTATDFIKRHQDQIDRLIKSHDEDRRVWSEGLIAVRNDVDAVKEDVHDIRVRIDSVLPPHASQCMSSPPG